MPVDTMAGPPTDPGPGLATSHLSLKRALPHPKSKKSEAAPGINTCVISLWPSLATAQTMARRQWLALWIPAL